MPTDDRTLAQDEIQVRLKEANEESQRLREENDRLRAMLGINHSTPSQNVPERSLDPKPSTLALSEIYTPERKIAEPPDESRSVNPSSLGTTSVVHY